MLRHFLSIYVLSAVVCGQDSAGGGEVGVNFLLPIHLTYQFNSGTSSSKEDLSSTFLFPEETLGIEDFATVDDVQNMLRGVFDLTDVGMDSLGNPTGEGGDGVLSRAELGSRVDPVLRDWLLEDVYEWIEGCDTDDDGLLSQKEIVTEMKQAMTTNMVDVDSVKYRFHAADVDKNGWLSEKEANYYRNPLWSPQMHGWLAGQCVIALDTDESATVSTLEFNPVTNPDFLLHQSKDGDGIARNGDDNTFDANRWKTSLTMPGVPPRLLNQEFEHIDKDRNNEISLIEMAGFVRSRSHVLVVVAVDRLFQILDKDGDNVLSVEEVASSETILSPFVPGEKEEGGKIKKEKKNDNNQQC